MSLTGTQTENYIGRLNIELEAFRIQLFQERQRSSKINRDNMDLQRRVRNLTADTPPPNEPMPEEEEPDWEQYNREGEWYQLMIPEFVTEQSEESKEAA